jgi:hypothetical protein
MDLRNGAMIRLTCCGIVSVHMVTACGAADRNGTALIERMDSAGIEVIRVLRPPVEDVRLAEPLFRIGSEDMDGSEHLTFQLISDVVVLPSGRVVVVDNRGARVSAFDDSGQWLFDVGRRGQGPGEFTGPLYASVLADTLYVWDALQRRISRFSSDEQFYDAQVLADWTAGLRFAAVQAGYIREVEWGQLIDPAPARGALVRVDRSGASVDTLVSPYPVPERGWVVRDPATGVGHMVNPPAFEIYPPWTVLERELVRLDPGAATVEFRDIETGALKRTVRLPYAASEPTAEDREVFFRGIQEEFGIPDAAMVDVRTSTVFAERRPPVSGLVLDDYGRIWVAPHAPGRRSQDYVGSEWDVIDLEGATVVRARFPDGFRLMSIANGRAYGITTLAYGIHVVDVFDLLDL